MVQAAAYALQATIPSNSPHSPLQLVIGHDIIFHQQMLINWDCLKQLCQIKAGKNNAKENKKCQEHTHHVGNLVYCSSQPINNVQNAIYNPPLKASTLSPTSIPKEPSISDVVMLTKLSVFATYDLIIFKFSNPFAHHSQAEKKNKQKITNKCIYLPIF